MPWMAKWKDVDWEEALEFDRRWDELPLSKMCDKFPPLDFAWTEPGCWSALLDIKKKSAAACRSKYPHKCPKCKAPCYIGFLQIEHQAKDFDATCK